jgi:hypothetical protein
MMGIGNGDDDVVRHLLAFLDSLLQQGVRFSHRLAGISERIDSAADLRLSLFQDHHVIPSPQNNFLYTPETWEDVPQFAGLELIG